MSNPRTGAMLDKLADTVALFMWGPRTRSELENVTGYDRGTVAAHVKTLHAAGVIRIARHTPTNAEVYEMQTAPFMREDATRRED